MGFSGQLGFVIWHYVITSYSINDTKVDEVTVGEAGRQREVVDDVAAPPLLCAGLIGYRSLVLAGEGNRLGIYGFGAAAPIGAQGARFQGRSIYAFTSYHFVSFMLYEVITMTLEMVSPICSSVRASP